MTLDQKLAVLRQNSDHDRDGLVTSSDLAWDLTHNYDNIEVNGLVYKREFVNNYMCIYGDDKYVSMTTIKL